MNKNNNKTMNERTHNPLNVYKNDQNSNRNNNHPNEEFATSFDVTPPRKTRKSKK